MSRINRFASVVVRSSLLWGGLASLGFYVLIHTGTLKDEFFYRYFANHWVLYAETIAFFVALASLVLRSCDVADQRFGLKKVGFDDVLPLGDTVAEGRGLLAQLDRLPASEKNNYLPRRLREALEGLIRKGSADDLESDSRFLSDVDAGRGHAGYAMVRLIIWAIPILGFLGTVIGITIAIAALDPKALEQSMNTVTAGLGVAFDTTALALALSMCLMFVQYVVDKQENRLLSDVDARSIELLTARFPSVGGASDPQMNAVRRMAEAVIGSVDRVVERQAELWRGTIDVAERRWEAVTSVGREQLEEAFGKALTRSIETHRKHLLAAEEIVAEQNRKHWSGVQQALEACSANTLAGQRELAKQTDATARIVESVGQIASLEDSLNRNLASLASSQHLQETLLTLSAAVNLLNARLERIGSSAAYAVSNAAGPSSKAA